MDHKKKSQTQLSNEVNFRFIINCYDWLMETQPTLPANYEIASLINNRPR
jgi:hypothetical protein